mmetsp:Transcript_11034/g.22810  ORF Transcript_11034/g.22810 Transcript_11034/m.22810 type:complete len:254 (+) Transcript_11034:553-1314(+)
MRLLISEECSLLFDMLHGIPQPSVKGDVVIGSGPIVQGLRSLGLEAFEQLHSLLDAIEVGRVELRRGRRVAKPPGEECGRVDQGLEFEEPNTPVEVVVRVGEALQQELVHLLVLPALRPGLGDSEHKLDEGALLLQEDVLAEAPAQVSLVVRFRLLHLLRLLRSLLWQPVPEPGVLLFQLLVPPRQSAYLLVPVVLSLGLLRLSWTRSWLLRRQARPLAAAFQLGILLLELPDMGGEAIHLSVKFIHNGAPLC